MTDFDLIVKNGLLIDGIRAEPHLADIAVLDGRIAAVGLINQGSGKHFLDAQGSCVAPGFIDAHTHDEAFVFSKGDPLAKISQGVTTDVFGACGKSLFPVNQETGSLLFDYLKPALAGADVDESWSTWRELKSTLPPAEGSGLSMASMVGHGSIRIAVMGFANRLPSPEELSTMQALLQGELEEGCLGLSLGLSYPPGVFAEQEELITLSSTAARLDRPVAVHLHSESSGLIQAVDAMIEVARKAGCRMILSHHKAAGRENHGLVYQTIERIEKARSRGIDICMDVYPYTAGNTSVTALVPPWVMTGGVSGLLQNLADDRSRSCMAVQIDKDTNWENLVAAAGWGAISISSSPSTPNFEGLSLLQIADELRMDPMDALFSLLTQTQGQARVIVDDIDENDVCTVLSHPLTHVISDSTDVIGKPHPRLYGTFPRVLGRYVREKKVLGLVDAVKKMTSGPAERYNLLDRGVIVPGARADLVLFKPDEIADTATYQNPRMYPMGISHVVSAGKVLIEESKPTGEPDIVPIE
jgi:N-acyl-D-amino-acid deacylase